MKNLLFLAVLAAFVFSCKTEKKANEENATMNELQQSVEESNSADLANYEYVCNHCKLGSHEAGTCPCGMEYEKNATFKAAENDLSSFEYICDHCKMGSHEAGKCACGMEMVKNPDFTASHDEQIDHNHGDKKSM